MFSHLKNWVRPTPFAIPFIYLKGKLTKPTTQNDEALILATLLSRFDVPKCFIEFGFGGWEFNCAPLAFEWDGLLVDGDNYNVRIARTILPRRVVAKQLWITLETLSEIRAYAEGRDIGILSIDVDGNDYWFWESLIDLKPAMLIAEYNSTFGTRPVTVPYDPNFDYRSHEGWTYYGASLTALAKLFASHDYSLIDVFTSGVNSFFVRNDLLGPEDRPLDPVKAYREQPHVDGSRPDQRWEKIKDKEFVTV